jgi:hypothetical protein
MSADFQPYRVPFSPPVSALCLCGQALLHKTLPVLAAVLCALAVICGADARATAEAAQERSVKAAYLSKFVGYVDFPGAAVAADAPYTIGVVGADDIGAELAKILAGRTINNRPVAVRTLDRDDSLAGVHMLFIGGAESERSEKLLHSASKAGVLTVTEFDSGLRRGSVINFRLVDERVRFEVSLQAADKAKLRLSSRLLSVAYLVQKGSP